MSPTRKKTATKKSAPSSAKKKAGAKGSAKRGAGKAKSTRKKAAAKKTTAAKKTAAKKAARKAAAAKKTAAKKAAAKKSPRAKSSVAAGAAPRGKKAAKAPAAATAAQREVTGPAPEPTGAGAGPVAPPKRRPPRVKPIPLSREPHPKFGFKFECFHCQAKFYDLHKPDPICPKCGADQRDRPRLTPQLGTLRRPRKVDRPMAPLLDEDDETPREAESFDDLGPVVSDPTADDMFDDAVSASVDDDGLFEGEETQADPAATVRDSEEP